MSSITVLLVDDHTLFRQGLSALLQYRHDICLVGEAGSGAEAIEKTRQLTPDVILMDIHMRDMSGLEALRRIKAKYPTTRVIMLTVSADEADLFQAIKSGAQGYLLKSTSFDELLQMIKSACTGAAALSPTMAARIMGEFVRLSGGGAVEPSPDEHLTRREREVLNHLAGGASNKAIASGLGISEHTVKKHLRNMQQKLRLENRVQLALYAAGRYDAGGQQRRDVAQADGAGLRGQ